MAVRCIRLTACLVRTRKRGRTEVDLRQPILEPRWQATAEEARLRGSLVCQDRQASYECGYWLDNDAAAFEAWAREWLSGIIGQSDVAELTFNVEVFERRRRAREQTARAAGGR